MEVHETIGSTNDRARELLRSGDEGVAVVAELQTAGRGRRGRTWTSPPGRNLTVSVAYRPMLAAADAWQVACAVAVAACEACRTVADVRLKWPNDLVVEDGRKLGGILVETAIDGDRLADAVIGIGINVNWPREEMPAEIERATTSLLDASGRRVGRAELLTALLGALDDGLAAIEQRSSPLERYRELCTTIGADVTVDLGDRTLHGTAVGLDAQAGLVVVTERGQVAVTSGEVVRVRPLVGDAEAATGGRAP